MEVLQDMEFENKVLIETNIYQTPVTQPLLDELPEAVAEQLLECLTSIEFIKRLISPNRPYYKDLPRDERGAAIVDITNPPIMTDADYFRPAAIHFQKHGCYTFLRPNSNPNSEFRKFWDEEIRRCYEGYIRPEDGAWITGYNYWFLNYHPMMINKIIEGTKRAVRVEDFPFFFEGNAWRYYYLYDARANGQHAIELAKRGCSKSHSLASIMSHNLILGESEESKRRVITVLTAYQKEYLADSKDGTLSKFKPAINFLFSNTPFPHLMLKNSPNEMTWQMGYKDEYGVEKGSLNQVLAVSAKDDPEKLRGKRGTILYEEMGSFKGLLSLYDITRRSVEDGGYAFALQYLVGTAAEDESDFSSAKTLLYNAEAYNIHSLDNVYDKPKQGKPTFGYFFPAYINRAGCYNKDGVSDVVKSLIEILMARYKAKFSSDPKTVLRVIAEDPITPAEAIIKVKAAYFPITALTERLQQIDIDSHFYDDVYIGQLSMNKEGEVSFKVTNDTPIRRFGVENDTPGAVEIFAMPEKDKGGKIPNTRYIIGHDPVDNDVAESSSLSSTFVLDLWTDTIVAEYTGRQRMAEDNYEIVRLLCLFYNAKCLYEAHPYSQEVMTPEGLKKWENIKVGDMLFSPTKGTVRVTNIPVDEEMPIYKIKLADGREVEASDNHIWLVYKGTSRTPAEMTTMQMIQEGVKTKWGQSKFFIPEHNGVEYNFRNLPIDPYTMGLILAEGSIRNSHCTKNNVQISSSIEDMKFYFVNIPYQIQYIGKKGVSWHVRIPNCKNIMMSYGLYGTDSHSKFIPTDYLYSNRVQRMELLKGLMDGDGYASTNGASIFITCSERLAKDILSLARSLGIKGWLQTSRKGVYRVALASVHKIFKLPRKVVEQHVYAPYTKGSKASAILNKTAIVSIEYSHNERGKCVTVDAEDGLYMIGDYIVTHNCNKKGLYAYFSKMNCTHLLADTPEYLRDKQLVKYSRFGSNQKGVNATAAINNYANGLIRDWLLKPVNTIIKNDEGVEEEVTIQNLYRIRNRALLEELIAFNPEINVDRCFIPGTFVQTDKGIKQIQDIELNNNVLTSSGVYESVIDLHKNRYSGELINIRALGNFESSGCTPNHPILCRHKVGAGGKYWMKTKNNMSIPRYKRADTVTKEDYVLIPIRQNLPECSIPEDLLYVLGWYIADGNISSNNYVKFYLGEDQYDIGVDIKNILDKYFAREKTLVKGHYRRNGVFVPDYYTPQGAKARIYHSKGSYKDKVKKMWIVEISSKEAQQFFKENGGGPKAKTISDSIYNTSGLLPLLRGFFEGDGHYRCEKRVDGILRNSLEVNSIYRELIYKIRQILLDNDIWCTLRKVKPKNSRCKVQYNINIINNYVSPIISNSKKFNQEIPMIKHTYKEYFLKDEFGYWVPVKEITRENYSGYVYNISVDNNPSYVANGYVTHNCRALGMVMLYREEKMILYGGEINGDREEEADSSYLGNDPFFKNNYDYRFKQ